MQILVWPLLGIGHTDYWLAGTLTTAAALIVIIVMLATSRAGNGDSSRK